MYNTVTTGYVQIVQPCPTCGKCPTCGQYKPTITQPYVSPYTTYTIPDTTKPEWSCGGGTGQSTLPFTTNITVS